MIQPTPIRPRAGRTLLRSSLQDRAARLWPDSPYLQSEWIRAVTTVRNTKGGWRCDNPVRREATHA